MPDWFRAQPKDMPPRDKLHGLQMPAGGLPQPPATPRRKPTGWTKAQAA